MAATSKASRLTREFGGFSPTMKPGEQIVIEHAGETLVIQMQGRKGSESYQISLKGPDSFKFKWLKNEPRT